MAILKKLAFLLVLSLSANVFAEQVSSTKFRGLNNNESSVIIDPSYAQDLLNVDVTPGGQSIKKRSGYGLYKSLQTNKPLHGGIHFFDSSGNDVQVWGSSTSLYGIISDATPTQLISSATLNSIWDCADSQGSAYCVNSNRDAFVRTNGATMTWYASPLGTMVASTPDRVVVAGVSGNANTLYVSQSNTFTNFAVGINASDPFEEIIASPGSRITHITWGCGKLLWWKDQSFGTFDFEDQFNVSIKTVSDTIGTLDNTSAIDPGGNVWFRGQDAHTYKYDCSFITKESIEISPNIQITGRRSSNYWTQTSQSDWDSSTFLPAVNFSTTVSVGNVAMSSYGVTNVVLIGSVTYNQQNIDNYSFEAFSGTSSVNWLTNGIFTNVPTDSGITPQNGSRMINTRCNCTGYARDVRNSTATINSVAVTETLNSWALNSITVGSDYAGHVIDLYITCASGSDEGSGRSDRFISNGNNIEFYSNKAGASNCFIDSVLNSPKASSETFTSQGYNTGLTASIFQIQGSSNTANPVKYSVKTGPSGSGPWTEVGTSSGTNYTGNAFIQYTSTYSLSVGDFPFSSLGTNSIVAKSTGGIFLSQVHPAPNFASWSTLGTNSTNMGGSHAFYVRGGGSIFTVQSATPAWISATSGNLITSSTGTYIQFRDDFATTSSTASLLLSDFTLNWNEGSANDQSYMFYFDNAIWETVSFGVGQSTNNYTFKRDLINDGWTIYNFGGNGFIQQRDKLYFGGSASNDIFNFGTVTSDSGTVITAYWQGKDFTGQDPFLQNQLNQIDVFAKKDAGSTLTATYTTDTSTATSYAINLSTSASIVQSRKLLPPGKLGYTFNLKLGDTSNSSSWEIFGYRITFNGLPYRPTP